jgi:DNA-binding transcriptional LysR family regulator
MAAARALSMSQPAVSNAIKQIEGQIGFALFERVNNRLFPTDAARLIYDESEPLFAMHAALEVRMHDLRDEKVSRLRILSTPPLGLSVIPETLERFMRSHASVRTVFDVRELDDVIKGVEAGTADLGFGLSLGAFPALEVQALYQTRMVFVCRRDHPLAREQLVTPEALQGHAFVALDSGTRMGRLVREAYAQSRQPFLSTVEVRFCNTACVLADAGLGVSVVDPFSPIASGRRDLVVLPFEPFTPCTAYAFWSARKPIGLAAHRFLREMVRALEHTLPEFSARGPGTSSDPY